MKILELTNYSAGICGVWQRVKHEAFLLSKKGHEIKIFSSNLIKGKEGFAPEKDQFEKIEIRRFPAKKLGGESFMKWNFEKEALNFHPDIIIAHSYRHPHTVEALKVAKKINAKVFLVTHAPFERNSTRTIISKLMVKFYDLFIGKKRINQFDKIIAITKWEIPYLKKLGVNENKIVYIPNGIPEEFFKQSKFGETNKILFLGRISPIKNIETLIKSIKYIEDKEIKIELVGPYEEDYMNKLKEIIKNEKLEERIIFSKPIFNLKEKIKKIDSCKIFILPSKSEAMPQSLIEAMAREKIVIASDNLGAKDLIEEGKNGYLFEIGNSKELAQKINLALKKDHTLMKKNAKNYVKKFSWIKILKKIEDTIR